MAEIRTIICDIHEGELATAVVTFKASGRNGGKSYQLDVCDSVLNEWIGKSHAPRHGRTPGISMPTEPSSSPKAGTKGTKRRTKQRTR